MLCPEEGTYVFQCSACVLDMHLFEAGLARDLDSMCASLSGDGEAGCGAGCPEITCS